MNLVNEMFRLSVERKPWKKDDQQSGEHVPGGSSCGVPGQLQRVAGLRLVQLPRRGQDVPAQHAHDSSRERGILTHPSDWTI